MRDRGVRRILALVAGLPVDSPTWTYEDEQAARSPVVRLSQAAKLIGG